MAHEPVDIVEAQAVVDQVVFALDDPDPEVREDALGAYRGSSISRKVFDRVMSEDTLIQQYVPAPRITFENDENATDWKYDLRAYAYGGEVQMIVARIYQGQITNFSQSYGGYCPIFVY